MLQILKTYFTSTTLFLIVNIGIGQNSTYSLTNFSITQTLLPGGQQFEYEYKNGVLTVYEIFQTGNSITFNHRKKAEYSKNVTKYRIATLDSIINKTNIFQFDSIYSEPMIDGVSWTFLFQVNGLEKNIYLDNYYLAELDPLLTFINSILPVKKRLITFDFVQKK